MTKVFDAVRRNAVIVLLVAALVGSYILGQRQTRRFEAQQDKDRKAFLDIVRGMAGRPATLPDINITLPSLNAPATVRRVAESPRTIRVEVEAKGPISPQEAQKRTEAGARRVKIQIRPLDLRNEPPENRIALIVEDPATGAFACITGSLCEGERGPFTEITVPKFDAPPLRSKSKIIGGFPAGVGFAYEVLRFDLPIVNRISVDALLFAYPRLSAGLGLSKPVWGPIDLGVGYTMGAYQGPIIYASIHLP